MSDEETAFDNVRRMLLVLAAAHHVTQLLRLWHEDLWRWELGASGAALIAAASWGLTRRGARSGTALAALAALVAVIHTFPNTYNHLYFEALLLMVVALYDGDAPGRAMGMALLRAIVVCGLVWTGVQKLWWGLWWDGALPAWLTATDPRFSSALGWLLDAETRAGLELAGAAQSGGPFAVDSALFLAAVRIVPIGEIVCGLALCWERIRVPALWATLALLLGIELVAREVYYGLFFASAAMAFAPAFWMRRWAVVATCTAGLVVLLRLLAPGFYLN